MKTITEFAGPTLKNAAKIRQELVTAGKSPEELPQALGEALKLEGDKLNFILNALEVVGTRLDDLKRVVVLAPTEGEKVASGGTQKGDQYYRSEYYPPLQGKGREPMPERGERGGRGGKDRDKKRRKRRGRRGERPEGDTSAPREAGAGPSEGSGGEGAPRSRRPPRHRRGPGGGPGGVPGGRPGSNEKREAGGPPRLPKPREIPLAESSKSGATAAKEQAPSTPAVAPAEEVPPPQQTTES